MTSVKGKVDLHFHTECSGDSWMPLFAIVPAAERLGLAAIAKTDHDSVSGCTYLIEAAAISSVEYIPAVELSTSEGHHILGYYVDPEDEALVAQTRGEKAYGRRLLEASLETWKKNGGKLPDDIDAMLAEIHHYRPHGELSRKQVCSFLAGIGAYPTPRAALQDSKEKLKGFTGPAHTPPTPEESIEVIRNAGGVAIVAHPKPSDLPDVERYLAAGAAGVGGLNVKVLGPDARQYWREYTRERGLVLTGGTDWHGPVEHWNLERKTIADMSAVEGLKAARDAAAAR